MVPNLGASGAIACVIGAFMVTYPRDKIRTVVIIGWFVQVTFIPAIVMVGLWFLTQLFSEVGALAQVQAGGGVAYMAHIGGFIFGMLTCQLFESRKLRRLEGLE
jgi:membrane associated rhomboid family serine protease